MSKLEEGKNLFKEEKYDYALKVLTEYLNTNNNHADALFFRGLCYRKVGQFENSINDLTAVITKLPEEADLYSERGVSYYHLKDYETAVIDMDKAVELQPENPYRYSSRAYIRAYVDIDGAIADYEKATQIDPKDELSFNNLGLLLERKGKMKQAKKHFSRSNELMGYDPEKRDLSEDITSNDVKPSIEEPTTTDGGDQETIGKVMLDVFRNRETRKEYFKFLKGIFKK